MADFSLSTWQLIINGPGYFNTPYDLPDGQTSLGRADDNDIVLSGDLVSRRHACFVVRSDGLAVKDSGSRNGCRLNGQPVQGEAPLKTGDTVTVGENTLTIVKATSNSSLAVPKESGQVRHFGGGQDISGAVLYSKEIRNSLLVRALDNVGFEPPPMDALPPAPIAFDHLVFLYRAAERLTKAQTLQDFLETTIDELLSRVEGNTAVVLLDNPLGPLLPATIRHSKTLEEGELPVSDAVIQATMAQGSALVVADVHADDRFAHRESLISYGADQVLCVPLGTKAPFLGVLYLTRPGDKPHAQLEDLVELCTATAHLLVSALQKFGTKEGPEERLLRSLERHLSPSAAGRRAQELRKLGRTTAPLMETNTATVLFADLAGFTALSSQLGSEALGELLMDFYTQLAGIVFSFDGTLDKFTGDGLMAVFGYPLPKSDDAVRGVRAAMAMRNAWVKMRQRRKDRVNLELKVGLATGPVVAGTIPLGNRVEFVSVGNTVNYASWLCGWAMPGQVLVTDGTLSMLGGNFEVTPQGDRTVKEGRHKVAVFEVVQEDYARMTKPGVR
jgi:adenylate cyclase